MVMALTALFSILAFYSFQLIQQQYLVYKRQNERMEVYQRFSSLLFQDFSMSKTAIINANELQLDNANYLFQDSMTQRIRNNSIYQDTFLMEATPTVFSFENKSVNNGLIDYGQITIHFFQQKQTLTLYKQYSAYDLITHQE